MPNKEYIIAIIPSRYGSTRLPAKPLIDLCGMPMIQHVYERTRRAKLIHRVLVAADDARVVEVVKHFGGEVVMTPKDVRSGSDRVAYVARDLANASIIVNIQGDEPLIEPVMIDEAVQPLIDDPSIAVGTLVKQIDSPEELTNPNVVKVVLDIYGFALYFSRSSIPFVRDGQSPYTFYYKHIGLYVFRRDFLLKFASLPETALERIEKLEQLRILEHGFKIKAAVTRYDSVPVDTPEDVEKVRKILEAQTTKVN